MEAPSITHAVATGIMFAATMIFLIFVAGEVRDDGHARTVATLLALAIVTAFTGLCTFGVL